MLAYEITAVRATTFATIVLAVITAYYAWQNRNMVSEMRAARELAVRPFVAIDLSGLTPLHSLVRVVNVGAGPAVDLDLEVLFVGKGNAANETRTWKGSYLAPGAYHDFMPRPPDRNSSELPTLEQLGKMFDRVEVSGTMRDSLGNELTVYDRFDDIAGYQQILRDAQIRMPPDEMHDLVRAAQDIVKKLDSIQSLLKSTRAELGSRFPQEND